MFPNPDTAPLSSHRLPALEWSARSYTIDGEPQFLISGELHYFRVPRDDWGRRLDLLRAAGGNCVATLVPWILYERVEGEIRFDNTPERDLEGFLRLCRERGLHVIVRPGPYQYSEMKYAGLPGWLQRDYPEVLARNSNGGIMFRESVSYLHPVFLEKAKRWFDVVCPILARHTVAKGGAIVFAQFDNELTGVHEWYGGWDYNTETMGFGRTDGRYPRFLAGKFGDIAKLNASYGTDYGGFADVRPLDPAAMRKPGDRRRVKDYQDFYFGTVTEYAEILTGWMREAGIDCDFIHNSANSGSNAYHVETAKRLEGQFLLGSDLYYNLNMDWNANNPTPKYAVDVFLSHESLRHMGFPPTVLELPGGSPSAWPPITPEDLACCYMTNVALGMKGLNYYVFSGGYNPDRIGVDGHFYDYQAAVGPDGSLRPHYRVQQELGAFLREHAWLSEAERESDFYIGLDREFTRSKFYTEGYEGYSSRDATFFQNKGLLITSFCAGLSPETLDLHSDELLRRTDKPLLVAAGDHMAASIQARLVEFVKRGGRLLLAPVVPGLDDEFQPCTILRDFLGGAEAERYDAVERYVQAGSIGPLHASEGLWLAARKPDGSETLAEEAGGGGTAGWMKAYPNGGIALWFGMPWKFIRYEHMDLLRYLLEKLGGGEPLLECDNPNVWTSIRSGEGGRMLFIMNLFSSPMEAGIRVRSADGSDWTDLGRFALAPMEVKPVAL